MVRYHMTSLNFNSGVAKMYGNWILLADESTIIYHDLIVI
jgi:hypothetical protein